MFIRAVSFASPLTAQIFPSFLSASIRYKNLLRSSTPVATSQTLRTARVFSTARAEATPSEEVTRIVTSIASKRKQIIPRILLHFDKMTDNEKRIFQSWERATLDEHYPARNSLLQDPDCTNRYPSRVQPVSFDTFVNSIKREDKETALPKVMAYIYDTEGGISRFTALQLNRLFATLESLEGYNEMVEMMESYRWLKRTKINLIKYAEANLKSAYCNPNKVIKIMERILTHDPNCGRAYFILYRAYEIKYQTASLCLSGKSGFNFHEFYRRCFDKIVSVERYYLENRELSEKNKKIYEDLKSK